MIRESNRGSCRQAILDLYRLGSGLRRQSLGTKAYAIRSDDEGTSPWMSWEASFCVEDANVFENWCWDTVVHLWMLY